MSKDKKVAKAAKETKKASSPAREAGVDPVLASLFASSSGPVTVPVRNTTSVREKKQYEESTAKEDDSESEATSEDTSSDVDEDLPEPEVRPRKRRRLSKEDDIETTYLNQLVKEEQKEISKRQKKDNDLIASTKAQEAVEEEENDNDDDTASSASNDLEDLSDLEDNDKDAIPQHESLSTRNADYDKTRRTVFLGNVSTEAIKSKSSRKELEAHLKSALTADSEEKIESLRFRSTAFDVSAGPKKAAYAKKELMDETAKCTNAYAVFNTEAAARKVAKSLNGTLILGRHLHTDWLAHPTAIDHKRCVFVGNLNFVDIESNIDTNTSTGELEKRRPRAKEPADAEEGLWRAFEKCGRIESVRVIRDKTTRVGKGFAYVQFTDEVGTEKALALDGKKFPPMLPRLLRVSRAKRVLKKDVKRKREDEERTTGSRRPLNGSRNGSRSVGMQPRKKLDGVVFEGYRASADKGMKFKMKGKKKGGVKPSSRSSKRGSAFKASGGKKKRDLK